MVRRPPPKTSLAFQDDQALMTPGPIRDALLAQMRKMGAKDVRLNAVYGKVRKNGTYDFSALDDAVNAARAHGLRPQLTLMSTPAYNPDADQGLSYEHNDPKAWQQYAKTVAQHFKGRVGRYSVGNEMNWGSFLKGAADDPRNAGRSYRNIYRAGYGAIKGVDKGAQVLAGELTSGGGDARQFLKGFLGGKRINTAGLAYHPYQGPNATAWDINQLQDLQKTLARYKRMGKLQTAKGAQAPLYITEMGYQRGTPNQVALSAAAYRKAQAAGAREYLQYQLTDKQQPATAPDAYGQGGSAGTRPAWDTSVGTAGGDLSAFARALAQPKKRLRKRR
jgi:hypothetical protein